jgi:tRNA pseudouridine55 synthase
LSRRRKGRRVSGIVLLDKPAGLSSNQALQQVKHAFKAQKAGHTGNLDPFATGMLPICLGEASKTAGFMLDAAKRYRATARFGLATATGDPEGEVILEMPVPELSMEDVQAALTAFTGEIDQVPPMYSALKHQGRRLYQLAREGETVERAARKVTIYSLAIVRWSPPELEFEVHCSKGTYVRTLGADIAEKLGCCAHLTALRRLSVEPFEEGGMHSLEEVLQRSGRPDLDDLLLPADAGLAAWPQVWIDAGQARAFGHGNPAACDSADCDTVRVYLENGSLLGLGRVNGGRLSPVRVFLPDVPEQIDPVDCK